MFGLKRGLTVGAIVASVVPILGIAASGYWLYDDIVVTAERLDKAVASAKHMDVPLTASDIEISQVAPGLDGAKFLAELHREWSALGEAERHNVQLTMGSFLVNRPALPEGAKASLAVASKLADLAGQAAHCSDYSRSKLGIEETDYAKFRLSIINVSRILCGRAAMFASKGQWSSAFGSLNVVSKLGEHMSKHDGLEGLSADVAVQDMAMTRACQLLNAFMDSAECRVEFRRFLDTTGGEPDILGALEREALVANSIFGSSESFNGGSYAGVQLNLSDKTFQKASAVRMLEFWTEALPSVRSVAPDQMEMAESLSRSIRSFSANKSPTRVLVQSAVQRHESVVERAVSLTAKHRLAEVLGVLVSSKVKNGDWPQGIDGLGIDLQDPSSGGLLVYQKTDDGLLIYSAGLNRLDDEGSDEDIVLSISGKSLLISGR